MFIPASYAQNDLDTLHEFITANSFATLVTHSDAGSIATHLPLLLDRSSSEQGELFGHMARANPQAKISTQEPVLAIFQGPHAYISPRWYQVKNSVPTWSYVAVHVYGYLKPVDQHQQLRDLKTTVEKYESTLPEPWSLDEADRDYINKLSAAILSFRIVIERIEGAWKLNQQHDSERRQRTIEGLLSQGGADQVAIATLMAQTQNP